MSNTDINTTQAVNIESALQRLLDRGFKAEIIEADIKQPDGTTVRRQSIRILHTPPQERALAAFFADPDAECNFPGCKELQRQYKEALQRAGGSACTSCEKGKIMRNMGPLVIKAMGIGLDNTIAPAVQSSQSHAVQTKHTAAANTGTVEVSGPGRESQAGTGNKPSLLRRAAARVAKIFGAGA
jgi:hypothetical protein